MKKFNTIFVIVVLILGVSSLLFAEGLTYIAVHYGNPEFASVIDRDEYPDFRFYTTAGDDIYRYHEQPPLVSISKPNYLDGYYGKLPETMGFSPNYQSGPPILIVGSNGIIAAVATGGFYGTLIGDSDGGKISGDPTKAMKALKKGKQPKLLPEKDRRVMKSTPVGELEPHKKAKFDKKQKNLVGWELPDFTVFDDEGNAQSLKELCRDKNCMVIFYSMGGVLQKEGSRKDGSILREYYDEETVTRNTKAWSPYVTGKAPLDIAKIYKKQGY
jgi:hypothetical protein